MTGVQKGNMKLQLKSFVQSISQSFLKGIDIDEPSNWFDAFELLWKLIQDLNNKHPIVLFLDECPWMSTPKSQFLEVLEYYWNQHFSSMQNVKLIICGSSASWVIRKIINNKGGLHNRVTKRLLLKPFSLAQTKSLLKYFGIKLNNKQIVELFMLTGGIPFYLQDLVSGRSATELIDQLAFNENGLLFSEFDNLLSSLFKSAEVHVDILRVLAKSRSGLSQTTIVKQSKMLSNGGTCTKKLNELVEAGFLLKIIAKSHDTHYRLIDEYCYFYLKWIEPLRNVVQSGSLEAGYWERIRLTPEWYAWAAYIFESVCFQHIKQIRRTLKLPPTAKASSWRYKPTKLSGDRGAQIDLLFDRMDDAVTICEIKFTQKNYVLDKEYAKNIRHKVETYRKVTGCKKQIFIALICTYQPTTSLYLDEMVDQVVLLDDLFV